MERLIETTDISDVIDPDVADSVADVAAAHHPRPLFVAPPTPNPDATDRWLRGRG